MSTPHWGGHNKLYRVGTKWIQTLDSKINPFWCSVFTYWDLLNDILVVKTNQDILTLCIWYNSKLATNKTFFPDWYKKGIYIVGDILNDNGRVMTLEETNQKYHININFLNYFTIRRLVSNYIKKSQKTNDCSFTRPYIPFHIQLFIHSKQEGNMCTKFLVNPPSVL